MALKGWQKAVIAGGVIGAVTLGSWGTVSAHTAYQEQQYAGRLGIPVETLYEYRKAGIKNESDYNYLLPDLIELGISPRYVKEMHENRGGKVGSVIRLVKQGLTEHEYHRWKKHGFNVSEMDECSFHKVRLEDALDWKGCNLADWCYHWFLTLAM